MMNIFDDFHLATKRRREYIVKLLRVHIQRISAILDGPPIESRLRRAWRAKHSELTELYEELTLGAKP